MNSIELVASLKIDFDYDANFTAAQERVNRVPHIENDDIRDMLAHTITSRNLLVTKLKALSDKGYNMDSSPSRSVLREIDTLDMQLAFHGLV
jgi:hypothetical protein